VICNCTERHFDIILASFSSYMRNALLMYVMSRGNLEDQHSSNKEYFWWSDSRIVKYYVNNLVNA